MSWRTVARTLRSAPLAEPPGTPPPDAVASLRERLEQSSRVRLGRSLAIRHVPSGGCNGCELEINALAGVLYDLERLGLRFVASPAHADILLLTGPLTRNMNEAVVRTLLATPDPKWVVALGDCAVDGGVFKGSYAVHGGVDGTVPVDLLIRGCPPAPAQILSGLLTLMQAGMQAGA